MIHFEADCLIDVDDILYIYPRTDSAYIEIATGHGTGAVLISKDDLIRLRDKLNERFPPK